MIKLPFVVKISIISIGLLLFLLFLGSIPYINNPNCECSYSCDYMINYCNDSEFLEFRNWSFKECLELYSCWETYNFKYNSTLAGGGLD